MLRTAFLRLLFLLLAGLPLLAQPVTVRNYSRESYGAGSQNWGMLQASSGMLYFANNAGILSFDSGQWTLLRAQEGFNTRALCLGREERILYYSQSNQLHTLGTDASHRMVRECILDGSESHISEIWQIERCGEDLFFRDEQNIYRLSESGLNTYHFRGRVDAMTLLAGKLVIYAREEGLLSYERGTFVPFGLQQPFWGKKVCSLLPMGGAVLVVTEKDGLFLCDGKGTVRADTPFSSQLRDDIVFCAALREDRIALGTVSSGVFIFSLKGGEALHLSRTDGLQNNTVLSMLFDRDGNLWLGLDNGIDQVMLSAPEQPLLPSRSHIGAGYASALWRGTLYLGTNQGLFRMSDTGEVAPVEGIKGQVWDLSVIEGKLYCSTDQGLHVMGTAGASQFFPLNGVWKVIPLRRRPGVLLGCTYDGMFVLKAGADARVQFSGFVSGFDESSKVFEEDTDGKIWFSHWQKGLFRLSLSEDNLRFSQVERFSVQQGFPTDDNNIPNLFGGEIIFTTERGFYRYDPASGRAARMEQLNRRFPHEYPALRIFELPDGMAYYSSGKEQMLEYTDGQGNRILDSLSLRYLCNKRKLGFDHIRALSPDRILINTEEGFSCICVDRLRDRLGQAGFAPFVKNIYLSGQAGDSLVFTATGPEPEGAPLQFDHRHSSFRFEFVSPDFGGAQERQLSCLLDGYDKDWTLNTHSRYKEYTGLPPGKYIFRVRADSGECAVPFEIAAPWYRSRSARVSYVLAGLLALLLLVWGLRIYLLALARRQSRKREEELRKEQLRKDLEVKANDLAASTMEVIHKNETILKIDDSLSRMKTYLSGNKKGEALLQELRDAIRESMRNDNVWQQFQTNFDIVHSGYLSLLGERYPSLSQSERRICVYLKMGLRSKEMAPLLNMTPRSVEMLRHRIRQKIGLRRSDNLSEFLDRLKQD